MRLFTAPPGCSSPPSVPPSAGPRRPVLRWTTRHWPRTLMPASEVRDTCQHPPDTNFGKQRGTSKSMVLVPLFALKFLHELVAGAVGTSNRRHWRGGALFLRSARVKGADMTETIAP